MERKESEADASSSSSKPDAAASSSKAPSADMMVYSRKRKRCPPDPDVASTAESPPVDMMVYSRKRKKCPPDPDVASTAESPPVKFAAPPNKLKVSTRTRTKSVTNTSSISPRGTSLILWDLQIHTTDAHVLDTFRKQGKPTPVVISFISRKNYITRYTWCCRLQMASVNEASEILKEPTYKINGAEARVTKEKGFEGSEIVQGKHKLVIWNMNCWSTKAFKYLRHLFQDCSCADIEIVKGAKGGGCARLRFRTKKGRKEAIRKLKSRLHTGWNYEVNDGDAYDDE